MSKNTAPPKCRTCGKEEWRHICSGRRAASGVIQRRGTAASARGEGNDTQLLTTQRAGMKRGPRKAQPPIPAPAVSKTKPSRKEYLKLKARDRRARQRAAREALAAAEARTTK